VIAPPVADTTGHVGLGDDDLDGQFDRAPAVGVLLDAYCGHDGGVAGLREERQSG
jgi:hypothetical protein